MSRRVMILVVCVFGLVSTGVAEMPSNIARSPLAFEERVNAWEKVEDVYWSYRIWPKENTSAKPARDEILSREQIVAEIETSLLYESALEQVWGEVLGPERIQSELDRISRSTQHPELLRDVFAALDHDPFLVAECFVRPRLVERLVKERYAWDRGIHREARERAKASLLAASSVQDLRSDDTLWTESTWTRIQNLDIEDPDPEAASSLQLTTVEWDEMVKRLARRFPVSDSVGLKEREASTPEERITAQVGQGFSPLYEEADRFAAVAVHSAADGQLRIVTASWPKTEFAPWLQGIRKMLRPVISVGGSYELPLVSSSNDPCLDDTWVPTAGSGPPTERNSHTALWTGAEMIVWGGADGTPYTNTGSRYDPAADAWLPVTTRNAPSGRYYHSAVWTGTEMIVWGGSDGSVSLSSGSRYNPSSDSWSAISTGGEPSARHLHRAVWTGAEMIIWGGYSSVTSSRVDTGGRYDPLSDSWTPTSTTGAPSGRDYHVAVWTGTEMIVWGGREASANTNTGGRYNPSTDSWAVISNSGAPGSRYHHTGAWTGTEMIVWGGVNGSSRFATGGRYNPTTDSWAATSTSSAPSSRYDHTGVWTGTEMIVWGGYDGSIANTGGRYDPATDSWAATSTSGAPSGRNYHSAVWTGTEMVVWGGAVSSATNTGGRYNPSTDSWTATSMGTAPTSRSNHTAVWTGTEMIIWGGHDGANANTGGLYDTATDSWLSVSTTAAPTGRHNHTVVWTGTEMVVWGGFAGSPNYYNTGGRYNPATDNWTATSTTAAPAARERHTAVWSGTELIVWGGSNGSLLNTGGRYDPSIDSWVATPTTGAPAARLLHSAVWSGEEMIIWGGRVVTATNTGGRYDPDTDSWTATSLAGVPSARYYHSAIWTGSEMIAWAGYNGSSQFNSGGRYDPATDDWQSTSTSSAPTARLVPGAVWSGSEMIVWGGTDLTVSLDTGGRYDPVLDTWSPTSLTIAPPAVQGFPAIWTGTEMIVWGGWDRGNNRLLDTGGRYCASGVLGIDFGDAPDPGYPTLLASDGARHPNYGLLYFGASVDDEADGQPTAGADGDDLGGADDEDGVTLPASLPGGTNSNIQVAASAPGLLNAWLDLNGDGDWDDADEQIFSDESLVAGSNALDVSVPLTAIPGATFMRFRLDSAGGLMPTGLAADGEVEDYAIFIDPWADLDLESHESLDPIVENSSFSYWLTITNNGPLDATGIVLTDTLDANVSFVSASSLSCSESAGVVTCNIGALLSGTSTQVEIAVVTVTDFTGTLSNAASVILDQADPVVANNSDNESTEVMDDSVYIFSDGFETGNTGRWSAAFGL